MARQTWRLRPPRGRPTAPACAHRDARPDAGSRPPGVTVYTVPMSGVLVYADKIDENAAEVRYEVRRDQPDGQVDGVLVIETSGDRNTWHVEGRNASSALAGLVVGRAVRHRGEQGAWPDRVAQQ